MGIDRIEKAKKPDKFQMLGPKIWLPLEVLNGVAYSKLKPSARALLLDLAAQLRAKHGNIYNNGDLTTAISVLGKKGWKSDKTIRAASRELEENKLIVKTRQGHLPNLANLYALTWLPLNENKKLDIDARGFQFHGYKLLEPPPVLKNVNG